MQCCLAGLFMKNSVKLRGKYANGAAVVFGACLQQPSPYRADARFALDCT